MSAAAELAELLGSSDPPLDTCLLLISEAMGNEGALERGLAALDALAVPLDSPTLDELTHHLFVEHGFSGDVDDYHSVDNSFLDRVLERRTGMPITLAATMIVVGARVGVGLHGVGLPGHFLVGVDDGPELEFVDAFAGVTLDTAGAIDRFHGLFGPAADFDPSMLAPVGTRSIVGRVLNNLVRTFGERDRPMLDLLLDLRVQLPGPPEERRLLIHLAESRARWDLAARLREELDPEDTDALGLRARLN